MRPLRTALFVGAGCAAWSLIEPRLHRFQTHDLPSRRAIGDLDILHISDSHLTVRDRARARFIASLPDRMDTPDLVLATGDMIDKNSGIDPLLDALQNIDAKLGKFYVLGSHDYYQTRPKVPIRYLTRRDADIHHLPKADTERLRQGLEAQGWVSVMNTSSTIETVLGRIRIAGVDDPHIDRHRTGHIERQADDALAIALVHAPDVISEWVLNGFDLVLAGHTHGGQLRLPLAGALVTNSDLPCALGMGPNRIGDTWLHVSPGLGSSTYSPIRFLARPEATLLRLRTI